MTGRGSQQRNGRIRSAAGSGREQQYQSSAGMQWEEVHGVAPECVHGGVQGAG